MSTTETLTPFEIAVAAGQKFRRQTPWQNAVDLIEAEGNRHRRKDKACQHIGFAGGRSRYIWYTRETEGRIVVTLFGNVIAIILPDEITLYTCGEFTACTREGFEAIMGRGVFMSTPGSKGGPDGLWTCTVHGHTFTDSVTIPNA